MRRLRRWSVLWALAGACDAPTPGDIRLALDTPNAGDGAVAFVLTAEVGREVRAVSPECAGCLVFARVVSETEIRGVVVGSLAPGPFVTITVSDIEVPEAYVFRVVGAADRDYAVRGSVGGYTVAVPSR